MSITPLLPHDEVWEVARPGKLYYSLRSNRDADLWWDVIQKCSSIVLVCSLSDDLDHEELLRSDGLHELEVVPRTADVKEVLGVERRPRARNAPLLQAVGLVRYD